MNTNTETMSPADVLAVIDELIAVPVIECDDDVLFEEKAKRMRTAVAAMIEREAALVAERDALADIADAAKVYFEGWMQDEASDDGEHWTGCSKEQHEAARNLKQALAASAEARKPEGGAA